MVMYWIDGEGAVLTSYLSRSPWSSAVLGLTLAVLLGRDLSASAAFRRKLAAQ